MTNQPTAPWMPPNSCGVARLGLRDGRTHAKWGDNSP